MSDETLVPEDAAEEWHPEGYELPDYDETEPLDGDEHDREETDNA